MIVDQLSEVPLEGQKGLLSLYPLEETFLKNAQFSAQEILSPSGDLKIAAARLFTALRNLDSAGVDYIIALRPAGNRVGKNHQ